MVNTGFGKEKQTTEIVCGNSAWIKSSQRMSLSWTICSSEEASVFVDFFFKYSRLVGVLPWHVPLTTTFSKSKRCP